MMGSPTWIQEKFSCSLVCPTLLRIRHVMSYLDLSGSIVHLFVMTQLQPVVTAVPIASIVALGSRIGGASNTIKIQS